MKHLKLYTRPSCYIGQTWEDYYVFLGRNRDSDCLTRANFDAGLLTIGGEKAADDDTPLVTIVRENHWAVGWVEWIAIHQSQTDALEAAEQCMEALEDYPVLDEFRFSRYEADEANEVWANCYRPSERIEYIRKHPSQFEFHDFADLLGCVRGKYFAGYASELIS